MRRANQTIVQERGEVTVADLGDDFITVFKTSSSGINKPTCRVPKEQWDQLSSEDRKAWLNMSPEGRRLVLHSQPSPLSSAQQQRPHPRGQSRTHTQNQRVSFHDQFDTDGNFVGGDDGDGEEENNQESDSNENIQVTMTQVSDNSQSSPPSVPSEPNANDTIFINTIKQPGKKSQLNPFDIRRFMSDSRPKGSDTQVEEVASYDPVSIPNTTTDNVQDTSSTTQKSKSKLSRLFKKKPTSAINNAIVTILAIICLVQCPRVISVSVHEEKRNTTLKCNPIMFYPSVESSSSITYNVNRNSHRERNSSNSLVDGGANGGIGGGKNTCKVCETGRYVDVTGVDNHELNNLPICTVAGMVDLPHGSILCYFHQYAYHPDGDTIHSTVQLMDHGNKVDCNPIKLGGTQQITCPNGTVFP